MAKAKPEEDTRTQRQKFIDAAREHGASEDPDAFRRAVRAAAVAPGAKAKKAAKKPTLNRPWPGAQGFPELC